MLRVSFHDDFELCVWFGVFMKRSSVGHNTWTGVFEKEMSHWYSFLIVSIIAFIT